MITTKADKLLKSLIDAGVSLTDFTILAITILRIQRDFKTDNEGRRQRDHSRQKDRLREKYHMEQQIKEEEQRKIKGLVKLRELGYVIGDDTFQIPNNNTTDSIDQYSINYIENKDTKIKIDPLSLPYSKEVNDMKEKQRDCCITFNIDYDLRLHQQALERACRRAKRNIYELRAERFNRPEHRSLLSVETTTLHYRLKQAIREINKSFLDSKSNQDKRYLQELVTYINQFEGDIDLLMCQMQYEPKVKETILFSSVTNDILDRMNLILHCARTLSKKISIDDGIDETNENMENEINNDLSNMPNQVEYIIKIKTNNEISSSLSNDTNVTVKLHGTYNKTSDIILTQSNNKNKWQSGQIDLFNLELNYLGDIYAIEIYHDAQYSSWKVDWIEIIDDATNIYRFPFNRLMDKFSNDNKSRFFIQQDIGPVNSLPSKPFKQIKPYKKIGFATYTIQVKTGKQPNKVTDSSVFLQVKGENGNFADNLCSANSAFKNSIFEPDQLDTFYVMWPQLAKIISLQLLVQSEGIQPLWFCEYITIKEDQTDNHYKFIVNQLFDGSNPENRNLIRHLTVYPQNINQADSNKEKEKPGYLLKLKTGEKGLSNMSTLPSINIILRGEKRKSEPYKLTPLDDKRILFQDNHTDEFLLSSKYYVGPIKTLEISSSDEIDQWFIETIIIRDIIQEQGPDRAIKLLIQGNKGKHEVELSNPVTMYNSFQPGHKDEYHIENMTSLGELQSIEIDITHPNIKRLGLDYIEITYLKTNDSYRFNINRMLDLKNPKISAKAEPIPRYVKNATSTKMVHNQLSLPSIPSTMTAKKNFDQISTEVPQGAKKSRNHKYKISIKTDSSNLMGSTPEVQLQLNGDKGTSDKIYLNRSEINSNNLFEKKNYDTFVLNIPDIGILKSAILSIDEEISNEWLISTFEISDENSKNTYQVDVNEILNRKNNPLTIHLNEYSAHSTYMTKSIDSSEKNIYKIKMKTIKKEFLGQDTKLQIELIDENEQSDKTILTQIEDNDEPLEENTIRTFTIDLIKDLGKLKKLKLSLVGSKPNKSNLYQPGFIEIFHPKSNRIYRVEYVVDDDLLHSDNNRLELIKSMQCLSDITTHKKTRPQDAAQSTTMTSIDPLIVSSYKKLSENILSENDEDDFSALNDTNISFNSQNLVHELNSLSEKLTLSSSRQIHPGDRVKTTGKKKYIDHQASSSLNESNPYRKSIETLEEYRNKTTKPIQLMNNRRSSKTKFDQQQANTLKNRHPGKNQNITRQVPQDKNMNSRKKLSPKKTSSCLLKQQRVTNKNKILNHLLPSKLSLNTRQYMNQLQSEIMNVKMRPYSYILHNNKIKSTENRNLSAQQPSIKQKLHSNHYSHQNYPVPMKKEKKIADRLTKKTNFRRLSLSKQACLIKTCKANQKQISKINEKNLTADSENMMSIIESQSSSNISKQTKSIKTNITTSIQSKTSLVLSDSFDFVLHKTESHDQISPELNITNMNAQMNRLENDNNDTILRNKQPTEKKSTLTIHKKYETGFTLNTDNSLSKRSMPILLKSVQPYSPTENEISQRRSRSVPLSHASVTRDNQVLCTNLSQKSSCNIQNQSKQSMNMSSSSSLSTFNQSSHTSIDDSFVSQQGTPNQTRKQNASNEYDSQTLTQDMDAITIDTTTKNYDSYGNFIQKSLDNYENEQSLQTKALLSSVHAKISRKDHQQSLLKISETSPNKRKLISRRRLITNNLSIANKSKKYSITAMKKNLTKENSDVQHSTIHSTSSKSKFNNVSSDIKLKTLNKTHKPTKHKAPNDYYTNNDQIVTDEAQTELNAIELSSKNNYTSSPCSIASLTNSSVTTNHLLVLTNNQYYNVPDEISNQQSTTTKMTAKLPSKLFTVDHMSTVYEESEPSTNSILNEQTSSTNYNKETIQDWLETSTNLSSNQFHVQTKHSDAIKDSNHLSNYSTNSCDIETRFESINF
ncbi:unnamed protein product [Rotaria socialis]|uniref:PLAT domain-containing protein n=1 Tax=Rotaria socialis TaxID=392032 RepID=A0A820U9U2_9BILA|nr:unnamed protein product [Rotaria socialis]